MKKITILLFVTVLLIPAIVMAKAADRDLGYAYCENLAALSASLNELAALYKELSNVYLLLEAEKVAGTMSNKAQLYRSAAGDIDKAAFKLQHYVKSTADAGYDPAEVQALYNEGKKVYEKAKK